MIQRMQQAQRRVLQGDLGAAHPDLPVRTPEQLVVLASIIEKETGRPEERTRVAAVFVNRLKQKMKLQSDPTIIYGLVGGKGTLGRPIMRSEIDQPTPYNTYVIDGLPPGPIANPGRASLEAAANPARTKELFFVADGTGGHAFADNYDAAPEKCRAAARYRAAGEGCAGGARPVARAIHARGACAPATACCADSSNRNGARAKAHDRRAVVTEPDIDHAQTAPSERDDAPLRTSPRIQDCTAAMALSSMTGFARAHGRQRRLWLGLGAQIGQCQGARAASAAAARLGCTSRRRRAPARPKRSRAAPSMPP